jgi:adenylate kinase family enzyme
MRYVNQLTLIFLGPQSCGKGTQLGLLKKYVEEKDPSRKIIQFGMGASLREFEATSGYTQGIVKESLARGEMQPDFLATTFFGKALIERYTGTEHVFADGYPRTIPQAESFHTAAEFYTWVMPTIVHINISDDEAIKRSLERNRADDTADTIRTRLAWSREQVLPTIEWFRGNKQYRVIDIDGEHPIEDVQQSIRTALGV